MKKRLKELLEIFLLAICLIVLSILEIVLVFTFPLWIVVWILTGLNLLKFIFDLMGRVIYLVLLK